MLSYSAFSQSYSKQERVFWLSQIWKDVSDYYYDPDKLVRINWDSLFVSYIPQVERSTDDDDFYRTLQRFMVHVRDGHTEVVRLGLLDRMARQRRLYSLPIEIEYIDGKYYITKWITEYFPNKTLPQEVIAINGVPFETYLEQNIMPYVSGGTYQWRRKKALYNFLFAFEPTADIEITVKDLQKTTTSTYTIPYSNEDFPNANIVALNNPIKRGTNIYRDTDKNGNDYFLFKIARFDNLSVTQILNQVKSEVADVRYIVLDLRQNSGGDEPLADSLLMGFLNTDTLITYPSQYRIHNGIKTAQGFGYSEYRDYYENRACAVSQPEIYIKSGSGLPTFTQPLYILVSENTFSAAETLLFPLILHYPERAVIFGTPTGGSTGAPLVRKMKGENYYRICTRGAIVSENFHNEGIIPHVRYDMTIEDYLTGRDTIFDYIADYYITKTPKI